MNKPSTNFFAIIAVLFFGVPAMGDPSAKPGKHRTVDTVQRAYAEVNGLKIYYEVHGAGKLPLVLLHGGGSTIETTFGKVLPLFAKHRRVIAYEQQGHGRTADIVDRPFSFEQSADDAAGLLRRLRIDKADFFGFSNGGSTALQIAIRHPKLVRKMVVASAMYKRDGLYPEFWDFMRAAKLDNMPPLLKDAYREAAPNPDRLQLFHDKCVKRMIDFKDWPDDAIRSIAAPTMLLIGDADCVRPEHAVEMFRLLPHSHLAVLPGGHGEFIGEVTSAKLKNSKVEFGTPSSTSPTEGKLPELVVNMVEEFLDSPMP